MCMKIDLFFTLSCCFALLSDDGAVVSCGRFQEFNMHYM